jgi:hypothetical protein
MADTLTREQNAQKYGYDATIFGKKRLNDDDLNNNVAFRNSFIAASKLVYQLHTGVASTMSDNELISWSLKYQRDYDNQTFGFGGRGSYFTKEKLANASPEVRAAFRYVHDSYDLYDDNFLKQVGSTLSDGLNLVTLPLGGAFSAGARTAGTKLATTAATRTAAFEAAVAGTMKATPGLTEIAARETVEASATALARFSNRLINVGIKAGSRPVLVGAIGGAAVEGGVMSYVDDSFRQDAAILTGEQHERSAMRSFGMTAMGLGFGAAGGTIFAKWIDPKMTPGLRNSAQYHSAAETMVRAMPGSTFTPPAGGAASLTSAGQRQADLMNTAYSRYGITLDQIGQRARSNWISSGHVDAAGDMLDQGTDMFGNARRATIELISEARRTPTRTTTVTPSVGPHNDVLLAPYESWIHKVLKLDPFLGLNRRVASFTHPDGASFAWKNLPTRDLFGHKFLNPIINHFDDKVAKAGLVQPILDMRRTLEDLRLRMSNAGDQVTKDAITAEIETQVRKFATDHGAKFKTLSNELADITARINDPNLKLGGPGVGMAGLDGSQVEALKKWLSHVNRLSDATQNPDEFLKQFKGNWQLFTDANKHTAGITGAFQHYLRIGADADMRIKTRDNTAWSPTIASPLRTKLEAVDNQGITFRSKINDGEDGLIAGGKFYRNRAFVENIAMFQRELKDGYYSDNIRVKTMINNRDINRPDNMENYGIVITTLYKKYTKGGNVDYAGLTNELVGLTFQSYDVGRQGDFLNSLRRLGMQQGRDGSAYTIPKDFGDQLLFKAKQSFNADKDAHLMDVVNAARQLSNTEHSPQLYGSRHMEQIVERLTRSIFGARLAPNASIVGVPGKVSFMISPATTAWNYTIGTLTGGRVIPNLDSAGNLVPNKPATRLKWDLWTPNPNKDAGFVANRWHDLTARNSLLTWAATPVTLPIRMVKGVSEHALFPALKHTWRTGAVIGGTGAVLWGGQEAIEYSTGQEFSFNPGREILKTELQAVDLIFGTPLRATVWTGERMFNKLFNTQAMIAGSMVGAYRFDKEKSLWQNLNPQFVNSTFIGDAAWNMHIPTGWLDDNGEVDPSLAQPGQGGNGQTTTTTTTTPGQGAGQQGLTPSTAQSDEDKRKLAMEQEETRTKLRAFGKEVADLNNAIAADGKWDTMVPGAAGTPVTRAARVDELVKTQQELNANIKRLGLGSYAEAIDADAYNTLTIQLVPNKGRGKPAVVPTFETREAERSVNVVRALSTWHNGLIALNHEVAAEGWNDARRTRIKQLETDRNAFYKNVPFLGNEFRQMEKDAYVWQQALLGASTATDAAYARVQKVEAQPAQVPPGGGAGTPPPGSGSSVAGGAAPPPGSTDPVVAAQQAAQAEAERKRIADEAARAAAANGGTGTPGTGGTGTPGTGGTGSPAAGGGSSGGGMGEAWDRMTGSFMNMTKVDGNDEVSNFVGATGNFLGAAASSGASWLGNTFNYLKNKPGGGGRALLREAGAGITAIFASAAFISPFLDKIGIGKIPLIGSIAKLGALVLVFMLARKGFDTVMDPAPPAQATVVSQGTGPGTHFPRLAQGDTAFNQSPTGGTPERYVIGDPADQDMTKEITVERGADGRAVLQLRSDSGQTFVSLGVTDATAIQSVGNRHVNVPADRLGAGLGKIGAMNFEAVTSDKVGADSFIATIDGKNHVFALQGQKFDELSIDR